MAGKIVFLCCAWRCTVRICAAYDPHHEGIYTICLTISQTILVDISHHVTSGKVLNCCFFGAFGSNNAVNRTQHAEVIARDLFKITQLVFRIQANATESVKATL